jgi:ketosteroid isomerase-like protein
VTTSPKAAVLAANLAFYTAFKERDMRAMEHLWSEQHSPSCIHPGWAPLLGRQAVMASWRAILGAPESPQIEMTSPNAVVMGDAAFVVCIERLEDGTIAATNVFVQEEGRWRLVHHQGGPMADLRSSRHPGPDELN